MNKNKSLISRAWKSNQKRIKFERGEGDAPEFKEHENIVELKREIVRIILTMIITFVCSILIYMLVKQDVPVIDFSKHTNHQKYLMTSKQWEQEKMDLIALGNNSDCGYLK